jgi:hypothetical protein
MSTLITVAELVADIDELISKVCQEEGLDKTEFLQALADSSGMDVKVVL